ncbi:RNA-directed DNA polymerase, eukaryota [Tanacetum coccineum]|uniref:RNA-directed DNA polymerase, eukaryota n=1 Tax=Tanacetum coccineum TaxID=301880 RepID=A0ABQ4ZC34_9ASTR
MRARFFWGADVGEKKLHWVSWSRVMASRLEGGLGVSSLFSLNRAMLFKWFWRFFHNPNALWVSVIRVLHGHCGRLRDLSMVGAHSGPWKGIISALRQLKDRGDGLQDVCYFSGREAFLISPQHDKLRWTLDSSDEFSVSSARYFLDGRSLFRGGSSNRWNNFVPPKLNILLWRIGLARIPTRDNLVSRGIVLNTSLCPVCCTSLETVEHVFADCVELRGIWSNISRWWNVPIPSPASVDSFINWADQSKLSVMQRKCFDAVICTAF